MEAEKKNSILHGKSERLPRGGDEQDILDFSDTPRPTDCKLLILDQCFLNSEMCAQPCDRPYQEDTVTLTSERKLIGSKEDKA